MVQTTRLTSFGPVFVVAGSVVPARLGLKAPAKARLQRAQASRY